MVEVPLEIEAELPREFDGAALLAASGLPRKVRIKATRDAVKLSTAYRADQLVGDIVRTSLRGTASDVQRVQEAVTRFVRLVRERRQDGAMLLVSSNGRGKIDVHEQLPQPVPRAAPALGTPEPPRTPPPAAPVDRLESLDRRIAELEAAFGRVGPADGAADRLGQLEERLSAMQTQVARALVIGEVAGPGMEPHRGPAPAPAPRRATAIDAYAEGLRKELVALATAALARACSDADRSDKAATLAVEAERLGAPADGTAQRLRDAATHAAARQDALDRLAREIDFYQAADLPLAERLLKKLDDGPHPPDPAPSLEPVAQAVARAAKEGDGEGRRDWVKRCMALCGWQLLDPSPGDPVNPDWHHALEGGGATVRRVVSPGLKRADGSALVRARVHLEAAEPEPAAQLVPEPVTPMLAEVAPVAAEAARQPQPPQIGAFDPLPAPFGDMAGESRIRAEEAAAAAQAASRMPKIVSDDPTRSDAALAAEVALVHQPVAREEVAEDVVEVHELIEPLPDDAVEENN